MASEPFIFDPGKPNELWNEWLTNWNEHGDAALNAWAFFTPERELIGIVTTDVNGNWIYEDDEPTDERDAWAIVCDIAKENDCVDIVILHMHHVSDPPGPCPKMEGFSTSALLELKERGITLRFVLIGNAEELDGVLFTTELRPQDIRSGDVSIEEGERLRADVLISDAYSEEERATLLGAIDAALANLRGETAELDIDLLLDAADVAAKKLRSMGANPDTSLVDAVREVRQAQKHEKSVLDLPPFVPPSIKYLN